MVSIRTNAHDKLAQHANIIVVPLGTFRDWSYHLRISVSHRLCSLVLRLFLLPFWPRHLRLLRRKYFFRCCEYGQAVKPSNS
jgi:hypothetical protein